MWRRATAANHPHLQTGLMRCSFQGVERFRKALANMLQTTFMQVLSLHPPPFAVSAAHLPVACSRTDNPAMLISWPSPIQNWHQMWHTAAKEKSEADKPLWQIPTGANGNPKVEGGA